MKKRRILIAPLDWGLGHAARCIPIIREIINNGHEAFIAADGRAFHLLVAEFPTLSVIRLKGYNPVYPQKSGMVIKMALQLPKFLTRIIWEHLRLKRIITEYKIDLVISDNRYGLWSDKVPNVLITHQLFLKMPASAGFIQPFINLLNRFFLNRYTQVWVPDIEGIHNLSGSLAHKNKYQPHVKFIGILSRFEYRKAEYLYDLLIILSGPEPQRSNLEKILLDQITALPDLKCLVVQGKTEANERLKMSQNIEIVSYLDSKELNEIILRSALVITRSGYSNIMDLVHLKKKAVLIPTPGQTEQEYLAEYLKGKGYYHFQHQNTFDLNIALKESKKMYIPDNVQYHNDLFKSVLEEFLK